MVNNEHVYHSNMLFRSQLIDSYCIDTIELSLGCLRYMISEILYGKNSR